MTERRISTHQQPLAVLFYLAIFGEMTRGFAVFSGQARLVSPTTRISLIGET